MAEEIKDDTEDELEAGRMPLFDHLVELRNRLLWSMAALLVAFILAYQFKETIYRFLAQPLANIYSGEAGRRMIATGLTEIFFTYIKVSFWAAICIAFPVISIQVWKFVAPGLYKNERRAFAPYLVATPVLFIMGAAFAFGMASTFKYIGVDFPEGIGVVSGLVGMVGALGGFLLPIMFGALLDWLGFNSSIFMLLYGIVAVSLMLSYVTEVRRAPVLGDAADPRLASPP